MRLLYIILVNHPESDVISAVPTPDRTLSPQPCVLSLFTGGKLPGKDGSDCCFSAVVVRRGLEEPGGGQ